MLRIRLLGKCALRLTHFPKSRKNFQPELLFLFCSYIPRHQINRISILSYLFNIILSVQSCDHCRLRLGFLLTSSRVLCPFIIFNGNTVFSLSSWGAGLCFHMSGVELKISLLLVYFTLSNTRNLPSAWTVRWISHKAHDTFKMAFPTATLQRDFSFEEGL